MISIIIPVYNREQYIEECIRSIQAQTYKNYEIILIDDGSTDDTLAICRALAQKEPAIRILESTHVGVSAARNLGLDAAKGDFVFFMDSDDVIHPLLLETLVVRLKQTGAGIAGTTACCVPEERWSWVNKNITKDAGPGDAILHPHDDAVYIMFHSFSPLSGIGGVMMRKDLIGETRFRTDLFLGEDVYFIYQNLIKGPASVFLKQSWYYARFHENNSTWNYSYQGFWSRFYHYKLIWENEELLGRPENAKHKKIAAYHWSMTCIRNNNPKSEDCRKICKALKTHSKTLLPCLSFKERIHYCFSIYSPWFYMKIMKMRGKW